MSNAPTVSIITPSFRHRAYIESTLQSVLQQAGDFYLDHIVVDGGSQDGTPELLADYEKKILAGDLPVACRGIKFRWLSEKDNGQAHAINKGFRLAKGEIIAWLNSDDLYADRHVLARCVEHFQKNPDSHFLYGRGYGISMKSRVMREERYVVEFPIELLPEIDMILQPSSMWRREVYEKIGDLNENMHFAFDWEYWLRIREHFKIDFIDSFLACNRLYEGTKTSSGGIKRKREIAKLLLEKGSFTERAIQAYLATPLGPPDPQGQLAAAQVAALPGATDVQPYPTEIGRKWAIIRNVIRKFLAPAKKLEQQFRQRRKRHLVRASTQA